MLSPRNPYPRKNPESHNTILPSTPKKLSLPQKRHPRNRSNPHIPSTQNATPPKTPLQSIRYTKTINHTHHSTSRAPSPVFAPIPRIVPPSAPRKHANLHNSVMIATRKNPARGGEEDEGKGAGWVLASVKLLWGMGNALFYWAKCAYCFPLITFIFFCFWGFSRIWGRLYNIGSFCSLKLRRDGLW
jgi:hypothetical protein